MVHARLVLSPHASARIVSITTAVANGLPGVVAVYTADDLRLRGHESGARRLSFLARDRIVFAGQLVAVALADTESPAAEGAAAVAVVYQEQAVVTDTIRGMRADAPQVRDLAAVGVRRRTCTRPTSSSSAPTRVPTPTRTTGRSSVARWCPSRPTAATTVSRVSTYVAMG